MIRNILADRLNTFAKKESVQVFAPTNIALCKYWGKRNTELNLPVTSSLSVSLGEKGAKTTLKIIDSEEHVIILNGIILSPFSNFSRKIKEYLVHFNLPFSFHIEIESNIPIAAGLASSACGFAALAKALNQLFEWELDAKELSILARLGSGSASRSIWQGFVEWQAGVRDDGMDSYGELLPIVWPELCIGLLIINSQEKPVSSRDAMQRTVLTSPVYSIWPDKVDHDLKLIKEALQNKDFQLLGKTAESNALTMHATMLTAWPPIMYSQPETVVLMQKIWQLRAKGVEVYFTQDAGPNLKLLFLKQDISLIQVHFAEVEVIQPFI